MMRFNGPKIFWIASKTSKHLVLQNIFSCCGTHASDNFGNFLTLSWDDVEFLQTKTIPDLGQCVHTVISCPLQFHVLFWYECIRAGRLKATPIPPQWKCLYGGSGIWRLRTHSSAEGKGVASQSSENTSNTPWWTKQWHCTCDFSRTLSPTHPLKKVKCP